MSRDQIPRHGAIDEHAHELEHADEQPVEAEKESDGDDGRSGRHEQQKADQDRCQFLPADKSTTWSSVQRSIETALAALCPIPPLARLQNHLRIILLPERPIGILPVSCAVDVGHGFVRTVSPAP